MLPVYIEDLHIYESITMPRTLLKSISSNITHHKKLILYTRGIIVEKSEKEATPTQIERDLNILCTTIIDTLNHDLTWNNRVIEPRSERPKIKPIQNVRNALSWSLHALIQNSSIRSSKMWSEVTISHQIIYCMLKKADIIKWITKKNSQNYVQLM